MSDPVEIARIKQRQFYLDMAERFTKMADEFAPGAHAENPLPIHGMTTVVVIHASDSKGMYNELSNIASGYVDVTKDGVVQPRQITGGRYSLFMEPVYPDQTEERYKEDLEWWNKQRKAIRDLKK